MKGHSSSAALNHQLLKTLPDLLGSDMYTGELLVNSEFNPADDPSRRVAARYGGRSPRVLGGWMTCRTPHTRVSGSSSRRIVFVGRTTFGAAFWPFCLRAASALYATDGEARIPGPRARGQCDRSSIDIDVQPHLRPATLRSRRLLTEQFEAWLVESTGVSLPDFGRSGHLISPLLLAYGRHFSILMLRSAASLKR